MSDNEILLIGIVCLGGGYLLGRAHAFVKTVLNNIHIQDGKQEIILFDNRNQKQQIEHSIRKIDDALTEIVEQIEKNAR